MVARRIGLGWQLCVSMLIVTVLIYAVSEPRTARTEGFGRLVEDHPFKTPPRLRARVDFWKDIFTRYGKYDLVVHHRMFPQAVFHVESLAQQVESMAPGERDRFLDYREKALKRDVEQTLKVLARGERAYSGFERQVEQAMKLVPGGMTKYDKAVSEDLVRVQRGIRERHRDAISRAARYLPYIEDIFRREGLPVELTRLPFIESSFDYEAMSSVGAAGIWQFMKGTARSYMTVNSIVDERRDPFVSSRAAARYLKTAYNRLGSWPLAITSYNHGVGGVAKKVAELGTSDIGEIVEHPELRPFGFASTNFYPEFLAALEVYDERRTLFPGIREDPPIAFRSFDLPYAQSGQALARRLGVPTEVLASFNLALNPAVWTGRLAVPRGHRILVPSHLSEATVTTVAYQPPPRESSSSLVYGGTLYHIVRKGESLSEIAGRYDLTTGRLRELNGMKSTAGIRVGQRLLVHKEHQARDQFSAHVGELTPPSELVKSAAGRVVSGIKSLRPSGKTARKDSAPSIKTHKVRSGETLSTIASRYKTSVGKLCGVNKCRKSGRLVVGESLRIP